MTALLAPFSRPFSPSRAALRLARGPLAVAALHLVLASLVLPAVVIGAEMLGLHRVLERAADGHPLEDAVEEVVYLWNDAAAGRAAPLYGFLAAIPAATLAAACVAAVLQWPLIQGSGSRWGGLRRGFTAAAATAWPALAGLLLWNLQGWFVYEVVRSLSVYWTAVSTYQVYSLQHVQSAMIAIVFGLWWLGRAAVGARAEDGSDERSPRCEACGYDLRHLPVGGRCTECGLDVALSVEPGRRRWLPAVESSLSLRELALATVEVLLHPSRFYAALPMRESEAGARRFAARQYIAIAGCAAVWLWACIILIPGGPPGLFNKIAMPLPMGTAAGLAAWAMHRGVAAVAIGWVFLRRQLPDPQHARRVLFFEAAYSWSFCLFNGSLVTSFMAFQDWLTQMIRGRMVWGAPLEVWVVLTGNVLLVVGGLMRYVRIIPQVRYANF